MVLFKEISNNDKKFNQYNMSVLSESMLSLGMG